MKPIFLSIFCLWLSTAAVAEGEVPTPGPLYLVSGGFDEPQIVSKFVELAGGVDANIVVILTASTLGDRDDGISIAQRFFRERGGANNVSIVHTRDKAVADTDAFVVPLQDADAIWVWGGRARRFLNAYEGTKLIEALRAAHKRGVLIAGTSAGAMVLTDLVLRPGDVDGLDIKREHTLQGVGLVDNMLLDVHAIARNRVMHMIDAKTLYPGRTAISIDENTAIILTGDRFEVYGRSYVAVYGVPGRKEPVLFLSAGDEFSLSKNMMTAEDCSGWSSGCAEY